MVYWDSLMQCNMKYILLLTGCINPNGMLFTSLTDNTVRLSQYKNAIDFYLSNTKFPIVFAENSGTDLNFLFQDSISSGRLECLSFNGNQSKERGKGYGECEIIQYALANSTFIKSNTKCCIIKITGRLIVKNIKSIIWTHSILLSLGNIICAINSDLSFPDSRIILAKASFLQTFLKYKKYVNDSTGYFFEHALLDTLKNNNKYPFSPFFIKPQIEGISGSTGEKYNDDSSHSLLFSIKYARYALSQRIKFKKHFR